MKQLLILGGLLMLAGGAVWWAKRPTPADGAQTPAPAAADTASSAGDAGSASGAAVTPPDQQANSERTETPDSAGAAAGGQALSLAQLMDYRRLALEMNKMYAIDGDDDPNAQVAAWPVDSDSLLAKYAALDKAGVTKVLADIHGLIEWQASGQFENKQAELLPYRVMIALETERDWLQVRLGEL
jgi:predicted lipid-binding transport protein (Tim44 family)